MGLAARKHAGQYERHRPELTTLYEVVRDNLETLYGAIDDGALDVKLPKHAKKELEAYLDCGLICRGFSRLKCGSCNESHLVAFSCKGRGFCPSCMGRRMCATAANLIEQVLPEVALRQWVLTFPFAWRKRLAMDGRLLGALTRIFVTSVHAFYAKRAAALGVPQAKTGSVTVVQRTSSDLRLNPHLHTVVLDGTYHQYGAALAWQELGHLRTREVGEVLEHVVRRMARYLERRAMLESNDTDDAGGPGGEEAYGQLAASAVSGQVPPAGPQWLRGLRPLQPSDLAYDKPLCASLDGFTLHAATRAGALDTAGREALLRYVLRPPVAQERVATRKDGLVAITLKRAYADGTIAVEMDPLSLLCRLAMSVPPPRYHTVKYAGVLGSASPLRSRIAPLPTASAAPVDVGEHPAALRRSAYRPWAELLKRTFELDVLSCPTCCWLAGSAVIRGGIVSDLLREEMGEAVEEPATLASNFR
ncbi:MAG TPA: transposase [Polyangiaceae bacterium]|nr:transposase [Polyangiaceae bacterium]